MKGEGLGKDGGRRGFNLLSPSSLLSRESRGRALPSQKDLSTQERWLCPGVGAQPGACEPTAVLGLPGPLAPGCARASRSRRQGQDVTSPSGEKPSGPASPAKLRERCGQAALPALLLLLGPPDCPQSQKTACLGLGSF